MLGILKKKFASYDYCFSDYVFWYRDTLKVANTSLIMSSCPSVFLSNYQPAKTPSDKIFSICMILI